jgi:hypothetical protein
MNKRAIRRIAVFCGSSAGIDNTYKQACAVLAESLCSHRIGLVYGGGNIGLMGILADEMLSYGGEVIGVIPQKLVDIELAHDHLSLLHIVPGMHERKALIEELSDAFIVMPGGIGTMDEFFEMYTWLQLGYHTKPLAILNVSGFYDRLLSLLEHMVKQDFFQRDRLEQLIVDEDPANLVRRIVSLKL